MFSVHMSSKNYEEIWLWPQCGFAIHIVLIVWFISYERWASWKKKKPQLRPICIRYMMHMVEYEGSITPATSSTIRQHLGL